jgi:glutamine synthetase
VGHVDGKPHPYDSRYVLQQQVQRLQDKGWTLNTGLEPEFNLMRRDEQGKLQLVDPSDNLDKPCYDYKGLSRSRVFLERLTEALQPVDFEVYQIDHEDANGQFEINYTYSDALTSADRFTFFRMAAGEIANDLGMICSFMPKPDPKRAGNGMHFHLSISSAENKNLFHDASDPSGMGLSKMAYHFAAGLLAHGPALCAFAAPTVNSYKRLVVGARCPARPGPRPLSPSAPTTVRPWCACLTVAWNSACRTPAATRIWSAPRSSPPASTASIASWKSTTSATKTSTA